MKKTLTILLILLFIFSNITFAENLQNDTEVLYEKIEEESANILVRLSLLKGYENGELGLERNITRAEFATIIIRMLGYEAKPFNVEQAIQFKDMQKNHWAYSTVRMCASLGYIKGYEDETFRPSRNITYAEAMTIMVRVLGYNNQLESNWPDNYLSRAKEIGITENLDVVPKQETTRGDIAVLVVNCLPVELKI